MTRRAAMGAAIVLGCMMPTALAGAPGEYEVKGAFLYNFARFVEWPTAALGSPDSPFVFGVLGTDPFGPPLDAALAGKAVLTHPVRVERFHTADAALHCQVLFVAASEKEVLRQVLDTVAGAPVLTVSDLDDFARSGGHIQMTTVDNRIRFEINVETAAAAHLKIGSKLLRLATFVHDGKH